MELGLADTGGEVIGAWVTGAKVEGITGALEGATVDLTMGATEGAVDGLAIGLAEGAVDGLAMGTLERTVDGMRVTGAVVEDATGEAVQNVRPV